jgi:plastocyanin
MASTPHLFSLAARVAAAFFVLAALAPASRVDAATTWTVIVGGRTPDNSVYANGFFPREVTIGVGDRITWKFDGFHNVAFLGGGPQPPFAIKDGGKFYGNPQVFFPVAGRVQLKRVRFLAADGPLSKDDSSRRA